jgi:hypothetical protein
VAAGSPERPAATPRDRLLDDVWVGNLPRRVAHAVHALLEASGPYAHGMGILTAAEVMLYDAEAMSPRSTAAALREGQKRGLVGYAGKGLWVPTNRAHNLRRALEDRYHKDTSDA